MLNYAQNIESNINNLLTELQRVDNSIDAISILLEHSTSCNYWNIFIHYTNNTSIMFTSIEQFYEWINYKSSDDAHQNQNIE